MHAQIEERRKGKLAQLNPLEQALLREDDWLTMNDEDFATLKQLKITPEKYVAKMIEVEKNSASMEGHHCGRIHSKELKTPKTRIRNNGNPIWCVRIAAAINPVKMTSKWVVAPINNQVIA